MDFLEVSLRSFESVNFAHFLDVTVLTITMPKLETMHVVDLSRFVHLRSFEILGPDLSLIIVQN
jgi:hypothetical protein